MADYVTRDEHAQAIARLEDADAELRNSIITVERVLRGDYEDKIARAVTGVTDQVESVRKDYREGQDEIQKHLRWQDRTVIGALVTFIVLIAVAVVSYYVFHIPSSG